MIRKVNWLQHLSAGIGMVFFVCAIWIAGRILMPKYQDAVIEGNFTEEYYRDPTKHDLLVIGNCESYENISTMTLWENYGITSYIRGNSNQMVSQSYYLLMDALRYETPKAVLFNVQAMTVQEQNVEEYNRMVFDGMRWSLDKWNGIHASAMEGEFMIEYVLPVFRFHSRWSDLKKEDFQYIFEDKPLTSFNGYYLRADVRPAGEFPRERRKADYNFPEKNVAYLDRIRKICEKKGILLILMKAPSLYPEWVQAYEDQILTYATAHQLPYYNFLNLTEETALDMSRDTYDEGLHLNVYGAEKIAGYLGAQLVGNYGFSDHRSEPETMAYYESRLEEYQKEKEQQKEEFEEIGYLRRFSEGS